MSGGYWHKDSFWLRVLGKSARTVAAVSAVFIVAVAAVSVASWLQARQTDPLEDERITELHEVLKANPTRTDLKDELRLLDYRSRRIYFSNLEHVQNGVSLLVIGAVILLLSAGISAELSRRLPSSSDPERERSWRSMSQAWRSIIIMALVFALGGVLSGRLLKRELSVTSKSSEPAVKDPAARHPIAPKPPVITKPVQVKTAAPVNISDQSAANWPGFLGPAVRSIATGRDIVSEWDYSEEKNMLWSVVLDKYGYSSPVVWDDKVFVAESDSSGNDLVCISLESGDVLWRKAVGPYDGTPEEMEELFDELMRAACTPVTDGKRVFTTFGNGDIACLDTNGKELWGRSLGLPAIDFGYASSPVLCEEKLIIQLELEEGSFLAALEPETGKELWRVKRPEISWATPVPCRYGDDTILLCADITSLSAYSATDGRQLWVIKDCLGGEVGSSAAFGSNMVYVTSLSEGVRGYRFGETSEPVWMWEMDASEMATPLVYKGHVYIASQAGALTCLDSSNGEVKWTVETESEFYASPVCVDGVIYAVNREGVMLVVKAGPELEKIGEFKSADACDAIPAFVGSRVIIRGREEVICYGQGSDR